jgi:hypothetical protein
VSFLLLKDYDVVSSVILLYLLALERRGFKEKLSVCTSYNLIKTSSGPDASVQKPAN